MSAWRRQALTLLPEYRHIIDSAENPMALWIELLMEFRDAMRGRESEKVARFMKLAAWCVSEDAGHLPNDTSTAAAVAFYEHLPENREYWPHFSQWFSPREFEDLLSVFAYHLNPDELEELKTSYAAQVRRGIGTDLA
jgi:hypothetical protein